MITPKRGGGLLKFAMTAPGSDLRLLYAFRRFLFS